jgi:hypothetical protein
MPTNHVNVPPWIGQIRIAEDLERLSSRRYDQWLMWTKHGSSSRDASLLLASRDTARACC